jgi:cell division septal protein FtsQ
VAYNLLSKALMKINIRSFLISNKYFRLIRIVFNRYFSYFKKFMLFLIALIIFSLLVMIILRPQFFTKFYQKSLVSVFSFLSLSDLKYSKIVINGCNHNKKEDIEKMVNDLIIKNHQSHILFVDNKLNYETLIYKIKNKIKSDLPWVDKVLVTRNLANDSLTIEISEYVPFAILKDGDKKYIVDKDGNMVLVSDISEYGHLVILSGKKANENIKSLFNILAINPRFNSNIYSANWVGKRRWDIRFENGLIVKLPEKDINKAWGKLLKIYSLPGSMIDLNMIDLRLDGKIYLEYKDNVIKEILSL